MSKGTVVIAAVAVLAVVAGVFASVQYTQNSSFLAHDITVDLQALWNQWKLNNGKTYSSTQQEAAKFTNFVNNYNFVQTWNADPTQTSQVGLNLFADMNTQEFSEFIGTLTIQPPSGNIFNPSQQELNALPKSVDWVKAGAVTPIKNQGQCGSCWAFSTTGSLEGVNFIFNGGNLLSFSEQQLVDCSDSYGNMGCDGGLMDQAFQYVEAYGIELESVYPYTAQDGTCVYNASAVMFKNTGYTDNPANNQATLAAAVVKQPVSVAIEADQPVFQLYTSGVITSASCGTSLDHGVLAVGYNVDGKQPYWTVKNSWGASWGNQGYVWIGKSASTSSPGICGIAMMASFPTFSG